VAGGRFSVDAVFRAVDRFTQPLSRMRRGVIGLTSSAKLGMRDADKVASGFLRTLGSIGAKAATAGAVLGAAGGAAAFAIGKVGADFEEAITAVGAVSLMTRDQIADLEKKALQLGSTTKFTATEAANAMELMGRAGFTNAEIIKGIDGVLNAAAAEGAGIEEVAGHVSNVLKGMGLAADEANRVADVLTLASARTNSSISSLGESMANVASTARQLNVPLESVVAAVAALQDVGLDASVAGSAVNTMLTNIAKPTDEVAAKMKKWGISFKDAKGNMLPFSEVIGQMSQAAKKSGGNLDQVAFFADLVGLRGQKAAANLKDLFNTGKLQALTKELDGAAGSAKKMADLRMQNLKGDLTLLKSATEGLEVALFNTESGPLRGVVQGMTKWVTANQQLIVSGFQEYLGKIRDALPDIVKWGKRVAIIVGIFASVALAVKAAMIVVAAFNVLAAMNPYVLIGMAIVAAIALVVAFWPEISAFFLNLWNIAKETAQKVADWFVGIWNSVATWFGGIWDSITAFAERSATIMRLGWATVVTFFQGIWDAVASVVKGVIKFIVGLVVIWYEEQCRIFAPVVAFFQAIWGGVKAAFLWAWGLISEAASAYFGVLRAIWTPVLGVFVAIWDAVKAAFAWAFDGISAYAAEKLETVKSIWGSVVGVFSTIWGSIKLAFSAVWDAIADDLRSKYDLFVSIFSPIVSFFSGLWQSVADTFNSVLGGLMSRIEQVIGFVQGKGGTALGWEGAGTGDSPGAPPGSGPQMVTPQDRTARTISESNTTTTTKAEVTIKDETGKAKVTRSPKGSGVGLRLAHSGAF